MVFFLWVRLGLKESGMCRNELNEVFCGVSHKAHRFEA